MGKKNSAGLVEWYDKLSDGYEELYATEQSVKYQRAMGWVDGHRFDLAVDVACGTGLFLDRVRRKCSYVVGVDLSRRMLEKARTRLKFEDVGLVRADCSALPLREKVADCLFAISLIEEGSESRKQVLELHRIAKTGGFVVVSVFHPEGRKVDLGRLGLELVKHHTELSPREDLLVVRRAAIG